MMVADKLDSHDPADLAHARDMAHKAAQLVTRAARGNLAAQPDDSHSNLGWDDARGGFFSHPLPAGGGTLSVGLNLADLALLIVQGGEVTAGKDLSGMSDKQAAAWLDGHLTAAGLKPLVGELPYELPPGVENIDTYTSAGLDGPLGALSAWFAFADILLSGLAANNMSLKPGPSPVRCWPHHFDIATYVSLEIGDAETAHGIGVGMSPGDDGYGQPYFYVNPWPHLDPATLPDPPPPGHWHTHGYVGAIATGDGILALGDPLAGMAGFLDQAFSIGVSKLGS